LSPRGPTSGGGLAASLFGGSGVQAGLQSVWRTLADRPYGPVLDGCAKQDRPKLLFARDRLWADQKSDAFASDMGYFR
jgi:hypothetical protein